MRLINRKLFIILKVLYLLTLLVFLASLVAQPQCAILGNTGLIQGGMIEAILFLTSIILIHNLKWKLSFITGMIGCLVFGLDILFYFFISGWNYFPQNIFTYTLIYTVCLIIIFLINIALIATKPSKDIHIYQHLKKEIIDLSTKFTRLEIRAISEKLNKDPLLIVYLITNMVDNREVYGEYFRSTKTVTFDQQMNINEIDQLLARFTEIDKKAK